MIKVLGAGILVAALSFSGCSSATQQQDSERRVAESMQQIDAYKTAIQRLRDAGLVQYDLYLYGQSGFAKTGDVEGFIKLRKGQIESEERAAKLAMPPIAEKIRACVFHSSPSYSRTLTDPGVCFDKLSYDEKAPLMVNRNLGLGVSDARKAEVLAPIYVEWNAAIAQREKARIREREREQREADQQRAREQKEAEKRAYDNSIQSLVE